MTEYLKTTLGRIGELGGRVVVFGSPGARRIPEGFSRETARSQMIEFLHVAADKAAQNGITIVIEPILKRNCNALNSVHDAVALAKAVNRREVKVLADLFHMTSENEIVEAVREAGEDLQHVHLPVPDLPGLSEPREVFENLPHYPIESFLAELRGLHYQHRISVEDLDRKFMNLEREGPLVLAYLSKMWKQMAQ
jgi:hydroxypyruvate isomerase